MERSMERQDIQMDFEIYKKFDELNDYYILKLPDNFDDLPENIKNAINTYFTIETLNISANPSKFISSKEVRIINESILYNFCGINMNSDYLSRSIFNNNYFALIKFRKINDVKYVVHSAITFDFKILHDATYMLYIDAYCVNKIHNMIGASILLNRLYDICILSGISSILLTAIDTTETLNFYKKMGFVETGRGTRDGLKEMENKKVVSQPRSEYDEITDILNSIEVIMNESKMDESKMDEVQEIILENKNVIMQMQPRPTITMKLRPTIIRPTRYKDYVVEYTSVGPSRTIKTRGTRRFNPYKGGIKSQKYIKTKKTKKMKKKNRKINRKMKKKFKLI